MVSGKVASFEKIGIRTASWPAIFFHRKTAGPFFSLEKQPVSAIFQPDSLESQGNIRRPTVFSKSGVCKKCTARHQPHKKNFPLMKKIFLPVLAGLLASLAIAATFFHPQNEAFSPARFQKMTLIVVGDTLIFNELRQKLASRLAAASPEKLYLQVDRTLLAPGDDLWFNAFLRNADDLRASRSSQILHVELVNPNGSVAAQKTLAAPDGTAAGDFKIAENAPGGLYKIRAWTNWMKNSRDTFERDIQVQKVVVPRLSMKLEFERKGLGPGDVVIARFDAQTLENQPLANQNFKFTASLKGENFKIGEAKTNENGRGWARFELPENLETADGLLSISIENDGQMEAISRPIPIVLNKIDLQFFPEGGDAVAGLPTRMAFKATNEFGKPADVEGEIFSKITNQPVAKFRSWHDGMGATEFIPKAGEIYEARLKNGQPATAQKAPAGLTHDFNRGETGWPLPEIQPTGMTLRLQKSDAEKLTFQVNSTGKTKAFLIATSRDNLFFFNELQLSEAGKTVEISIKNLPTGIARFTLMDENLVEQAERLAFVNRDKTLKISVKTDKPKYLPREPVSLQIQVNDAAGRPVEGQFSLAVGDDAQLAFADDKQGQILSSLLLEQDVRGPIHEPNFYFDEAEPKSSQALDFLLMTQGWRRFSWKEIVEETPLVFTEKRERMSLGGQVLNPKNGRPMRQKSVACWPAGNFTTTDDEGHFLLENVDLQTVTHLLIGRKRFEPVNQYGDQFTFQMDETGAEPMPDYYIENRADGRSILRGQLTEEVGEMIGATVKIMQGSRILHGTVTDFDGFYQAEISPGSYDIEFSYIGFSSARHSKITVFAGKNTVLNHRFESAGQHLQEVVITSFKVPLIEKDNTSAGKTISTGDKRTAKMAKPSPVQPAQKVAADDLRKMPTKNLNTIVATKPGTQSIDGQDVTIRGSRSDAMNYYVDGVRVSKNSLPRAQAFEQMEVNPGGLAAEFEGRRADRSMSEVVISSQQIRDIREADGWQGAKSKLKMEEAKKMPRREEPRPTTWLPNQVRFDRAREFFVPKYAANSAAPRSDFRPTIYWNPSIKTDKKGRATVHFVTNDVLTTFRSTLEGIGQNGIPGRSESRFFTQKPVELAAKLPTQALNGDVLRLSILLKNNTDRAMSGAFEMEIPAGLKLKNELPKTVELAGDEAKNLVAELEVITTQTVDNQRLEFKFSTTNGFSDAVSTTLKTGPRGFPVTQILAGNSMQNAWQLDLIDPIENTVSCKLTAYPSALEEVVKGMERMLRQPGGCFEQVSSSNYPNLLVLDFLKKTGTARPEIEARANQFLASGYQQLAAYECKNGGFDWWGRDPGHEGLTAYGLLQFTDMKAVFNVDNSLIDRTLSWIRSRRDGKGGWLRRPDHLHSWNGSVLDSYMAWAVAEAGFGQQFLPEINGAFALANNSSGCYEKALLANALLILDDQRAAVFTQFLTENQAADGSWTGSSASIMGSTGKCLAIETTALAALALMKTGISEDGKRSAAASRAVSKALDFIVKSKSETGFGSTQSTVLAMRALIEFAVQNQAAASDGKLVVQVDGKRATELSFSAGQLNRLEINDLQQFFTSSKPRVEVFFEGSKTPLPFDIELKYAARQPRNVADCPISMTAVLAKTTVKTGETVRLTASVKNESGALQASPMLVVGIPGGLTLQPWQLKKLVEEKKCAFYELWDGYAVFHFEAISAGETLEIPLDLRADVPGRWEAPASQAFLYYANDLRVFAKPAAVEIE